MKKLLCALISALMLISAVCPVMAVDVGNTDVDNLFTKLESMMPSDSMERIKVWRIFKAYMLDGTNGIDTVIKAVKGELVLPATDAKFKDFINALQNETQATKDAFIFLLNMYKAVPLEKRRTSLERFGGVGDTYHTEIVMDKLVFESSEQEASARAIYERYVPLSIRNEFKEHFYIDGVNAALDVDNFLVLLTALKGEFRMTDSGEGDLAIESYSDGFIERLAEYNDVAEVNGVQIGTESLAAEGYDILDGIVEFFNSIAAEVGLEDLINVITHNEIDLYIPNAPVAERPEDDSSTPGSIVGGGGSGLGGKQYIINYVTNGGNRVADEKHSSGSIVSLIKVPVREGYVFEGWYTDAELTKRVTKVVVDGNITLYASWVEDNGSAGNGHETPDMLNGSDHFAYVMGYPDGTVKPNDNITRAEVTAIFFRVLKANVRDANLVETNDFTDIESTAWFNTAISTMAKLGIVKGRDTNEFDPNAFITRAEFAAICARFDDGEYEEVENFTDVAGHWAAEEIGKAAAYGWIRGYEDGTFKPEQNITRAEAMTMINRVLNRIPEKSTDLLEGMTMWPDNSNENVWYYLPVQEATNSHDYEMKNNIYEKWTALGLSEDWTKYE